MGLLTETAEPAKEILGVETIEVVADRGYFKIEDIEACEKAEMVPYVPRPQRGRSVKADLFRKDEFKYDAETDSIICPAGQRLQPYTSSLMRGLKKINYANGAACPVCPLRSRCTGNQFRSVSRLENEAVLDRMSARLVQRPDILHQRRASVEHPFGTIKQWMYQGAFLMRGLEKVRAEFSLTALAYNIRRVLNLSAFDELMAAVKAARAIGRPDWCQVPLGRALFTRSARFLTTRSVSVVPSLRISKMIVGPATTVSPGATGLQMTKASG